MTRATAEKCLFGFLVLFAAAVGSAFAAGLVSMFI